MTKDAVADVLGVSARTIENWVNDGIVPAPKKLGNRVYWHPNAFYAWLDGYLWAESTSPDTLEIVQNSVHPQREPEKNVRLKSRPSSQKSELDNLRAKTDAKLLSLLS